MFHLGGSTFSKRSRVIHRPTPHTASEGAVVENRERLTGTAHVSVRTAELGPLARGVVRCARQLLLSSVESRLKEELVDSIGGRLSIQR